MHIEFDLQKDLVNRTKHGLSLAKAAALFDRPHDDHLDRSAEYGEERWVATGLIDGRVHVCVYTLRGETPRIISLRVAERVEADAFYEAYGG